MVSWARRSSRGLEVGGHRLLLLLLGSSLMVGGRQRVAWGPGTAAKGAGSASEDVGGDGVKALSGRAKTVIVIFLGKLTSGVVTVRRPVSEQHAARPIVTAFWCSRQD